MEITYLEDDDAAPRAQRPQLPQAPTRRYANRAPVPGRLDGTAWFICLNEECSRYGHVATGKNTPTHIVKRAKSCRGCRGLGILTDEDGMPCEECNGSGRRILSEEDVVLPVFCPHCKSEMKELEPDESPSQYPRMDTPHSEDQGSAVNEERGQHVGFGRNRQIS
jgi:Zn finger protein HypA/HybF involved in hydrogenase expression